MKIQDLKEALEQKVFLFVFQRLSFRLKFNFLPIGANRAKNEVKTGHFINKNIISLDL